MISIHPILFFWGYSNFGDNKYSNSIQRVGEVFSAGTFSYGYRFKTPQKIAKLIRIDSSANLQIFIQINYAPKYFNRTGEFVGGVFSGKPVAVVNVQYAFLKRIYVFLSTFHYLREETKMPFDSEYAYGFGVNNISPLKFLFTYSNGANRFPWSKEKIKSGFSYGGFTVGINYTVTIKINTKRNPSLFLSLAIKFFIIF